MSLPTSEEIARRLTVDSFDYEFDERDRSGNTVTVYGSTEDGVTFGFTVTVGRPWHTD